MRDVVGHVGQVRQRAAGRRVAAERRVRHGGRAVDEVGGVTGGVVGDEGARVVVIRALRMPSGSVDAFGHEPRVDRLQVLSDAALAATAGK